MNCPFPKWHVPKSPVEIEFFDQYLNRCGTVIGEDKLAELLLTPRADKQNICERQEAVRDVGQKIQFRQHAYDCLAHREHA